jgi:hypothetical protein
MQLVSHNHPQYVFINIASAVEDYSKLLIDQRSRMLDVVECPSRMQPLISFMNQLSKINSTSSKLQRSVVDIGQMRT